MPPATAASNRRAAPRLPGGGLEVRTVVGDHVLVRGDDRLAGAERGDDQRPGRLVAAHHLDDDVVLRVGHEVGRGVGQQVTPDAGRPGALEIADGDRDERDAAPSARDQAVGPAAATTRRRLDRPCPRRAWRRDSGAARTDGAGDGRDIAREW